MKYLKGKEFVDKEFQEDEVVDDLDLEEIVVNPEERKKAKASKTKTVERLVTRTLRQEVILTYNIKGGVGKSTIATNLALAVKSSPMFEGKSVALVDFDCGGANVSTIYNIPDDATIHKNLYGWEDIDPNRVSPEEVEDMLIEGPEGIMVAPAPLNFINAEKMSFDIANSIIKTLKKFFDIVVIDGAPNLSPLIDCALEESTKILLVANPEGQAVKQLGRITSFIESIEERDMTYLLDKMFIVVNQAHTPTEWDLSVEEIEQTVGRPVIKEIPNSTEVKRALHSGRGELAFDVDSDEPFSVAMRDLANIVVGAYPELDAGTVEGKTITFGGKKKKKLFGLF